MTTSATEFIDAEHKALFSKICNEEDKVTRELQAAMARHPLLDAKVRNITKVLPNLEVISHDAKQLSDMIGFASTLIENVSYKVRRLDVARSRVFECQQRVHDLLDLQLCCDGVKSSMNIGDFEKAAAHVHRYLSMDQRLLEKTADDVNQDSAAVNNSISLLQDAATKLRNILSEKFGEAVKNDDLASVERFFKLFPLLEMHDQGLDKYSDYLCSQIQAFSRTKIKSTLDNKNVDKRAGIIFADVITLLFEEIASTIEVQQPLVETYYGPGRILKLILKLQEECNKQVKGILNELWRTRQIEKYASMVRDKNRSTSTLKPTDPKDLDQLLAELTIIQSRYHLYLKFLRRKVAGERITEKGGEQNDLVAMLDSKLQSSDLCRLMQELLNNYLLLEHFYMEESVRKAIQMDCVEQGSQTSSMIDDVFFIVKKCIRRASSTSNIDGVCVVINNACGVLETEMCSALMNTMKVGFPSGYLDLTQAYNVMMQGRLQTTDSEQSKAVFIAHLNNTDVGSEYINTLCTSLVSEVTCSTELERRKLESCLTGLSSVSAAMGSSQELGLQQLRNTAIKPRVLSWLDSFSTLSHVLSEEEFSSYEANEPFIRGFIGNIDNFLSEFKGLLTVNNYETLVSILATEVNSLMEKVIMKTEFNRFGGLALDKEIRALVSYFSTATSWSVRDKLARLSQVGTVLNLEQVNEISDYWGSSPLPWRLTPVDIKKILKLRTDFSNDEINKVHF
uniref:Conserved oligomeric Golgi complex subunit 4 n=2 Tax=Lygus hesperus TaxID=30085 RepID=A0A0A9ZHB7_LYGHE